MFSRSIPNHAHHPKNASEPRSVAIHCDRPVHLPIRFIEDDNVSDRKTHHAHGSDEEREGDSQRHRLSRYMTCPFVWIGIIAPVRFIEEGNASAPQQVRRNELLHYDI